MEIQEMIDWLEEIKSLLKYGTVVVQSDALKVHKFTKEYDPESGVIYLEIAPAEPFVDYWIENQPGIDDPVWKNS